MTRTPFLVLCLSGLAASCDAVTLAPLFTDHAVLQQGKTVPVWGEAAPGEHVVVTFAGQSVGATADADGHWIAALGALDPSSQGRDLTVAGKDTTVLHDVVVGEVWLCSGQSNMEFVLDDPKPSSPYHVDDAAAEVAAATDPLIRQFKVERKASGVPLATAASTGWVPASPTTAAAFSAVGYFFAHALRERLDVPVGIINSSFGGTIIEAWMSAPALAQSPTFGAAKERYDEAVSHKDATEAQFQAATTAWVAAEAQASARGHKAHDQFLARNPKPRESRDFLPQFEPSSLFNGMIQPLVPAAIRGFVWYQGEQNTGHPEAYKALLEALITSWRGHFGQGDLPFYIVQLANYRADNPAADNWARLREAQAQALELPATGLAVTIDIGTPDNVHPPHKREVGRRLALIAWNQVYGGTSEYSGPTFESATPVGNAIRVKFGHAGIGLIARDKPVQSLFVAGADRKFYPAQGVIDRESLIVSSPKVPHPVAVRYAFSNAPEANLYNGAGLPAAPFRSDDW